MRWYFVIIERGVASYHRHPSEDRDIAEKWAQFHNLEAELKGLGQHAWVDEVELDEGEDIEAYLREADEDYYQCLMDGYFEGY